MDLMGLDKFRKTRRSRRRISLAPSWCSRMSLVMMSVTRSLPSRSARFHTARRRTNSRAPFARTAGMSGWIVFLASDRRRRRHQGPGGRSTTPNLFFGRPTLTRW